MPPELIALIVWLAVVNIAAFAMFGADKKRARKGKWRISEKALFAAALLGGSVGALLGMQVFRHKTKHWYFRFGIPLILLLQAGLAVWLIAR